MSRLRISRLDRENDRYPRGVDLTWSELASMLAVGDAAPCTLETCGVGEHMLGGTKPEKRQCKHKYGAAWTPAVYPPGKTRSKANVGVVSVLVADLDHMTDEVLDARIDALDGYRFVAHPSHSDGLPPRDKATGEFIPGAPPERAWRVIVALSEPVLGQDWPRFWQAVMPELGITDRSQGLDASTCDASRLYFLPVPRADAPFAETITGEGRALDVRALLAKAPPAEPEREVYADQHDLPPARPELLARARQRLADHGPAVEGQGGDNRTFSACAALVHGYALAVDEAWPLLLEWNRTCRPPWDEDELYTKLSNATSYASGPRGGERLAWEAAEAIGDDLLAVSRARKEAAAVATEDVSAIYEAALVDLWDDIIPQPANDARGPNDEPPGGGLKLDADAAIAAIQAATRGETVEPDDEPGFRGALARARREVDAELGDDVAQARLDLAPLFTTALDVLRRPVTPTPWLVRGLLRDGGVGMIGAGPKVGKTWAALELAVAIASGTVAFGADRFKAPRPRAVAYYFAEDDASAVAAHLRAFASGRGVKVEDLVKHLYLCPMGRHIDIKRNDDLALVLASCREIPAIGALFADPLRDIHSGAENEADDMADVLGRLRFLSRKLGCTVCAPHHAKKLTREDILGGQAMAGAALRGSSVIFGALDSLVMMARDEKLSDETHIVADVRAIIKGAKSAGAFGLKLTIVDDDRDQAKHAEWAYISGADKKEAEAKEEVGEAAAEDLAVALVEHLRLIEARKEPAQNVERLRAGLKWGTAKFTAALSAAGAKTWIHKPKQKWELTDLGRRVDFGRSAIVPE